MTTLIDGVNLRLCEILNGSNIDIHGHEIIFEKTGDLEYSSVYVINCNRKYVIDLSTVIVYVREIIVPDDDVIYTDIPVPDIKIEEQKTNIEVTLELQ
ncbi:MAG: hypothetical protein M3Z01_04330 [Thermoproteota archaeon]|nr:hypothetical protein [Thermoproteota archaeon]